MRPPKNIQWAFGLAAALNFGCSESPENFEIEEIAEAPQEAYMRSNASLWTSPGTIDVCFVTPSGWLDVNGEIDFLWETLETYYEGIGGVTFNRIGCPSPIPSDVLSVYYNPFCERDPEGTGSKAHGVSAIGKGKRLITDTNVSSEVSDEIEGRLDIQLLLARIPEYPYTNLRWTWLHELGHALGLKHEHARPDRPVACPGEPIESGHTYLTPFDYSSIMYYNGCPGNSNDTLNSPLSRLDRVAFEMMYPKSGSVKLGCLYTGCFETGSGVVLVPGSRWGSAWTDEGAWSVLENLSGGMTVSGTTNRPFVNASEVAAGASGTVVSATTKTAKGANKSVGGRVVNHRGTYTAIDRVLAYNIWN